MAELRNSSSGRTAALETENVVGRSPRSDLQIDRPEVSGRHALVRWSGSAWEVRDLGSRNGTLVDGVAVSPSAEQILRLNSTVCFGHQEETWTLVDDTPPRVRVVATDGTSTIEAVGTIVGVPAGEQPEATLYRVANGEWHLERADEPATVLQDQSEFDAAGKRWRFCCPSIVARTQAVSPMPKLAGAKFAFGVSADEEHVELRAHTGGSELHLGSRAHNYLLLTLARARLSEVERGVPEQLAGWLYQDELIQGLGVELGQLNIDVFRVRKHFAAAGFVDAASVIERRTSTRQIRIGVAVIEITQI